MSSQFSLNKQAQQQFTLKHQNLIPIYLLQDNLKHNFQKIHQFIEYQTSRNLQLSSSIAKTNEKLSQIDTRYNKRFPQMQKIITQNINKQIESNITFILSKQLANIIEKINQSQTKQANQEEELNKKFQESKNKIKYQMTQQNQKYFAKEINKVQKQFQKKLQQIKSALSNKQGGQKLKVSSSKPMIERADKAATTYSQDQNQQTQLTKSSSSQQIYNNNYFAASSPESQGIRELKKKIQAIEQFTTTIDKRLVQNFTSLKEDWKQLGTQLLDNKKILNKKVEDLNVECFKIKNLCQMAKMPQDIGQQSFKRKIMQRINDMFKLTSTLTPKSEFQMVSQRNKKSINRYGEEIYQIKQQVSKNNEYFTLYMNNSSTDDLSSTISKLKAEMIDDKKYFNTMFEENHNKSSKTKSEIQLLAKNVGEIQMASQEYGQKINKLVHVNVKEIYQKLAILQDLNHVGPSKMRKIHDTLDMNYAFGESQSSLNHLHKMNANHSIINKQLKGEIQKIKDQIFLLISDKSIHGIGSQDDILQMKQEIKKIKAKFDKHKNDSDEAIISRKPWICLSCDKQKIGKDKQKQSPIRIQRDSSRKKISLQIGKAGGFLSNRASQKGLKSLSTPQPQQKFQVYEKFREKYLSDTLKLPQIYKQKISRQEQYILKQFK